MLPKTESDGTPYMRPPGVETQIDEAFKLSLADLRGRLLITDRADKFFNPDGNGWLAGSILPIHSDLQPTGGSAMPLSGMLAAGLAVNEAFLSVSGNSSAAGRRPLGLSGWPYYCRTSTSSQSLRKAPPFRLTPLWLARRKPERWRHGPSGVALRPGCITLLAGKAVGAHSVGSIAAALALCEVLRLLHGGPVHQLIDLDPLSIDQRVSSRHPDGFKGFNPGFVLTAI